MNEAEIRTEVSRLAQMLGAKDAHVSIAIANTYTACNYHSGRLSNVVIGTDVADVLRQAEAKIRASILHRDAAEIEYASWFQPMLMGAE